LIGYKLRSMINGAVIQGSRELRFYRDAGRKLVELP
jgi:hypothetical protein